MNRRASILLFVAAGLLALFSKAKAAVSGLGRGGPITLSDVGSEIIVEDETAGALERISQQVLAEGGYVEYIGPEGSLAITSQALKNKFAGPLLYCGSTTGADKATTLQPYNFRDNARQVVVFHVYADAFDNWLFMRQPLHPQGTEPGEQFVLS